MFRFTIRDVLWLTALAALGVSWTLDHRSAAVRAKKAQLDATEKQRVMQGRVHALEEQVAALGQHVSAREVSAAAQQ